VEKPYKKSTAFIVNTFNFTPIKFLMAKSGKKGFRQWLRKENIPAWMRNKYLIVIAAFLAWILFFDRNNLISQAGLRMKLSDYREKKEYLEDQIASVNKEKKELLTNQDSLERFGREQYMMKKDDEDLYVIVPEKKKK